MKKEKNKKKVNWVFLGVTLILWLVCCVLVGVSGSAIFGKVVMQKELLGPSFGAYYVIEHPEYLIDPNYPAQEGISTIMRPAIYDSFSDELLVYIGGYPDTSLDGLEWFLADCTLSICYVATDLNGNVIRDRKMYLAEVSPCDYAEDPEANANLLLCYQDRNKNVRFNGYIAHESFSEANAERYRELATQYQNLQVRVDTAIVDGYIYYPVTVSLIENDSVIETWNLEQLESVNGHSETEACTDIWMHQPAEFFAESWWREKTPLEEKVYNETLHEISKIDYSLQHKKVYSSDAFGEIRRTGYSVASNGAIVEHLYMDMRPAVRRLVIPLILIATAFYWIIVEIVRKIFFHKKNAFMVEMEKDDDGEKE